MKARIGRAVCAVVYMDHTVPGFFCVRVPVVFCSRFGLGWWPAYKHLELT